MLVAANQQVCSKHMLKIVIFLGKKDINVKMICWNLFQPKYSKFSNLNGNFQRKLIFLGKKRLERERERKLFGQDRIFII